MGKHRFLIAVVTVATLLGGWRASSIVAAQGRGGAAKPAAKPAGPVPRTPEGKPDFTGTWDVDGVEEIDTILAPGSKIEFTPFGAAQIKKIDQADDPNARCLPWGPTRMMCCTRHPDGFVVHKDVIAILTESQQTFRLVYMDGRGFPKDMYNADGSVDRQVGGWMGFSVGRWEGDTLVVDTRGADDRTWIDGHGAHQHSDKMKFLERFQMTDANTIQYTGTVDDPVYFTKPWTFVKTFKRMVGDRIMSHSCVENEKDLEYFKPGVSPAGKGD
jgi:hypothetical protein